MAFAVKATCMYSLVFLFWEEEGGQPMERSLAVLVLNCRISTTQSPCTRSRLVLSCCPCREDISRPRDIFGTPEPKHESKVPEFRILERVD